MMDLESRDTGGTATSGGSSSQHSNQLVSAEAARVPTREPRPHPVHKLQSEASGGAFVVVVFGKLLLPDGSPTPTLLNRLAHTQSVYLARQRLEGCDGVVFLSAGDGRGCGITEAQVMQNVLLGPPRSCGSRTLVFQQIPEEALVVDEKPRSTVETCVTLRRFVEDTFGSDAVDVLLVTSEYHMPRAALYLKDYFGREISEEQATRLASLGAAPGPPRTAVTWHLCPHDHSELTAEALAAEEAFEHAIYKSPDGQLSQHTVRERAELGLEVSRLLSEGPAGSYQPCDPSTYDTK